MLARAGSKRPIPRSESRRHLAPFQSKTEDTHSLSAQTRQTNSFATGYVFLYRTGRKNGRSKSLLRLMDVETGRDNDGNFVYSHARGREMFPVEEGNPKNESALNCLASPPPSLPSFFSFFLIGHDFNFWFTPFSQPSFTIQCDGGGRGRRCPHGVRRQEQQQMLYKIYLLRIFMDFWVKEAPE